MKKLLLFFTFFISLVSFSQASWQGGVNPEPNQAAVILFDKSTSPLASYSGTIYAHTGITLNGANWQNVIGTWGVNASQPALTLVSGNIYKLDLTPTLAQFYGSPAGTITKVCVVFRNAAGNAQSADFLLPVGAFQATLATPAENSNTIISSGQSLAITASNTNGNATYDLFANGVNINSATTASYSFTDNNITNNKSYELRITQGAITFTKKFNLIVNPGVVTAAMPATAIEGINYNPSDPTKAILVLDARGKNGDPGKDFVYVAGSFNNYQPTGDYVMKKDPSGKFWLELTGLVPNQIYTYQYWVVDTTPAANTPALVKTADPYSTLVLSPFDDPYISANTYPNLPPYPAGQEREVTVLQTGQTPYNWQVTNFVKPKKEDLVIYEVLIRDFDANRNYQDLINRIDYFKNLKVNAIQLMPVMEYEGNESWGYNTSFHMALDKFYGTSDKLKEFVDLCHQNGIAVILDVALNHAFGRNPMVRMWMKDPDGDGWGDPAADNPYFNEVAKHTYSVGSDFNHAAEVTKTYTKRVVSHWINEYKIDGFRWDLTKGFTQMCTNTDEACTNGSPSDRFPILRDYARYSWQQDPTHYVIFEHLGNATEEKQWADLDLAEGKGVMMWGEMTSQYAQLAMGYAQNADISGVGHLSRNFAGKRLIGYPESHDKERLMYSAITYGNSGGTSPVAGNLNNALARMSAIGAMSLMVPGPKMIWHFAELGMQQSIYQCNNGTVNDESSAVPGDCKLDTKQQPQWTNNWLNVPQRSQIYNDWAKMIKMKIDNPVFEGNYAISPNGNLIKQRLYVYDNALPTSQLKNVVILANFSVASQGIVADFPYTGTWYNLMDNTPLVVTATSMSITIPAGQFRMYGNQLAVLNSDQFETMEGVNLYPNPSASFFTINKETSKVQVYSLAGQLVKSFNGTQAEDFQFDISDLNKGLYLVKATDTNNREKTMKFIKE